MPIQFRTLAFSAILATMVASPVHSFAQETNQAPASPTVPAPSPQTTPDGASPDDPCAGQPGASPEGQTLTGQVSDCGGVLKPPSTSDGGIEAPAPDPNPDTTPVIPPEAVPEQPANPT